jgi:probable HAF family extracellular repeat protein
MQPEHISLPGAAGHAARARSTDFPIRMLLSALSLLVIGVSAASLRPFLRLWNGDTPDEPSRYQAMAVGCIGSNAHDFLRVALNAAGHLAAGAPEDSGYHAILQVDGVMRDLGVLKGYEASRAYALNASDVVAGCSYKSTGYSYSLRPMRACLWRDGHIEGLPMLPGYKCSIARAINASGQAVGSCYTPHDEIYNAASHAALWENHAVRDLGVLPGFVQSSALAVNDAGEVVGTLTTADHHTHGFLWRNGQMQDLGTLPGCATSMATSINAQGAIIGVSGNAPMHMVLWQNGHIRDLGSVPGAPVVFPLKINSTGEVLLNAGTGSIRVGDYPRPYVWDAGHGYTRLSVLLGTHSGYFLWRALDLNDHGQIAAGGRFRGSDMQVYLLTPLASGTEGGR